MGSSHVNPNQFLHCIFAVYSPMLMLAEDIRNR